MKFHLPLIIGLGWFFTTPIILHATINRTVEKTFTVQPGGTLRVETAGGNITVEPGAGNMVKVVAKERIRADSEKEADEVLKNLTLTIEQQGNDVSAKARYNHGASSWFGSQRVQVDFVVTVPGRYSTISKLRAATSPWATLPGRWTCAPAAET